MNCILCGRKLSFFFNKNGYNVYRCNSCDVAQTDLKENYDSFITHLYDKSYFMGGKTRNAYTNYAADKQFIVKNMQKFLASIKKIKPDGKLLDVGCALGYFIELAVKNGYDAYGIDPSTFAVESAQTLVGKNRVKAGTLETVTFPKESFDIVTLFDVFEHVSDPIQTLQEVKKLLKPGGIIVIATGNTGSIWAKALKKYWTFYNPPQHLFFFSRTSLASLLETQGYHPLFWSKIGKWLSFEYVLHLAETAGAMPGAVIAQRTARRMKIHRLPIFLPVGDNMVVIAQKV